MQSTWLEDDPGGKKWNTERVNRTSLKLFLRFKFSSKIKFEEPYLEGNLLSQGSAFKRMVTLIIKQNKYELSRF